MQRIRTPDHPPRTFGETIRDLRLAADPPRTQRGLATAVAARMRARGPHGFDYTYLSKIETGRVPPPSVAAIEVLADELGVDEDMLLALAGKVPLDIGRALTESPAARDFFRAAVDAGLDTKEWASLTGSLKAILKRRRPARRISDGRAGGGSTAGAVG